MIKAMNWTSKSQVKISLDLMRQGMYDTCIDSIPRWLELVVVEQEYLVLKLGLSKCFSPSLGKMWLGKSENLMI